MAAADAPGDTPRSQNSSVARVRAALLAAGHPDTLVEFPAGTRTAADAAAAVGCEVAQIAKSMVFRAGARAVLVITSGANRVDRARVAAAVGEAVQRADATWVREVTGFAIGGTPPFGHPEPVLTFLDSDLMTYQEIWAAAGAPDAVFRATPEELLRASGAAAADFKES